MATNNQSLKMDSDSGDKSIESKSPVDKIPEKSNVSNPTATPTDGAKETTVSQPNKSMKSNEQQGGYTGGSSDRGMRRGGRGGPRGGRGGGERGGRFQNRGGRGGGGQRHGGGGGGYNNNQNTDNNESSGNSQFRDHGNNRNNFSNNRNNDRYSNQQQQQDRGNLNDANNETLSSSGPREEKKFTGRCRLFVGNLTQDVDEEEFKKMFLEYGEVSEVYLNRQKGFGFIRLDTRHNAEKAKMQLDGVQRKGRTLRVRFATHGAALKVRHLSPFVSNELLEDAFSKFGQVERAVVIVDDRGRPSGKGIVEFARKPGAQKAMTAINDGVFLLGSSPKPIKVEPLEQKDQEDGLPDKYIQRNNALNKEREGAPRFASTKSFEFEFGLRWKQLYEMEAKEKQRLKKEMEDAVDKLEMEMANAMHEEQANVLRRELQRLEDQRAAEEKRRREMTIRRQEEERIRREEEEAQRQERIMRQQQQEEQFRQRQMQQRMGGGMGRQDMIRQDMMFNQQDERKFVPKDDQRHVQDNNRGGQRPGGRDNNMRGGDRQQGGNQRDNMSGGGGMPGLRGGDMPQDMDMHRSDQEHAPPMQPPPAPPAGLSFNRERNQDMGGGMMSGGLSGNNSNSDMGNRGPGGNAGNNMGMRQSRFDQPPTNFGNQRQMGGLGNMGNMGNMGGNMGMGNNMRDRNMDRRDRRDDFESKRPRHF